MTCVYQFEMFLKGLPFLTTLDVLKIQHIDVTWSRGMSQWHSHWGGKGAECHPWQQKNCQKLGKRGENREKRGQIRKKKRKNRGKKRKNWEEKAKIGKVLSLCPSWQIGLATLLEWVGCWDLGILIFQL